MSPSLLADNDVLLKLAHWGLLDALPSCFGKQWTDVATLESIKHRARRADPKLFEAPEIAKALSAKLETAAELPAPRSEDLSRLQDIVDLDAGEVELISAALANPGAILITGDKRAMRALARPELADIAAQLAGRLVCLEQLLQRIAATEGAQCVIDGVLLKREKDSGIRAIIGPAGCSHEHLAIGLASYVDDLRKQTGELLQEQPPSGPKSLPC